MCLARPSGDRGWRGVTGVGNESRGGKLRVYCEGQGRGCGSRQRLKTLAFT